MARPDEAQIRVCTRSALAPGLGHDLPLQEIAAMGAEQSADGRQWYCAGLYAEFADTFGTLSTQSGVTLGRRLQEFVSSLELNLPGWPERVVFRAGGRGLRRRSIKMLGKLYTADGASTTDADATVTDQRRGLYIPFRRPVTAYKGEDFCIPASLFARGSLLMDLVATPVTGVTLTDTDVVIRADMVRLKPRQPTFWRFLEQSPTNDVGFSYPTQPEAFLASWAGWTGQRAADQLENQFGPTVGARLKIDGEQLLDGRITIQELNESENGGLYDAAQDADPALPIELPMISFGRYQKSTKAVGGMSARFEGTGALAAASGNGTAPRLMLWTEELLAAPVGSHAQVSHMRAVGAVGQVELKTDSADKVPVMAGKTVRLPKKLRALGSMFTGPARLSSRGRYGV